MHPLQRHRGTIAALIVTTRYQGRGSAQLLIGSLIPYATMMGLSILEASCRGGDPAEAIYPKLGFQEYGRLPSGLLEPWGNQQVYDEVFFWLQLAKSAG